MISVPDQFPMPKGLVTITLRDLWGTVVSITRANLVVTKARETVTDWATGTFTESIDDIELGTGGHEAGDPDTPIPPAESDIALETPLALSVKTITTKSQPTATTAQFDVVYGGTEGNGTITEAALKTSPGAVLFARVTFPKIIKDTSFSLGVEWKIIF